MNVNQIKRAIYGNQSRSYIVADIQLPSGHLVAIKMCGRRVSHRRIKLAMMAAKREWPHTQVFFRYGGTLITPELADSWQQYTADNGYWWPALSKWAAKAAKTASRINGGEA